MKNIVDMQRLLSELIAISKILNSFEQAENTVPDGSNSYGVKLSELVDWYTRRVAELKSEISEAYDESVGVPQKRKIES